MFHGSTGGGSVVGEVGKSDISLTFLPVSSFNYHIISFYRREAWCGAANEAAVGRVLSCKGFLSGCRHLHKGESVLGWDGRGVGGDGVRTTQCWRTLITPFGIVLKHWFLGINYWLKSHVNWHEAEGGSKNRRGKTCASFFKFFFVTDSVMRSELLIFSFSTNQQIPLFILHRFTPRCTYE